MTEAAASPVTERLQPLLDILTAAHGDRLRAVLAYGPWILDAARARGALTVLVVLEDASAARLRETSPQVNVLRRKGFEPLFFAAGELARSLDVFPLELLDMRSCCEVVRGEDPLAGLAFPHEALRLQVEEELRSQWHCFRQDVARYGHMHRPMIKVLTESFAVLPRIWRGLLTLAGAEVPVQPDALLQLAAAQWQLDAQILRKLRGLETATWTPSPPELEQAADEYDALLARLVDLVDGLRA